MSVNVLAYAHTATRGASLIIGLYLFFLWSRRPRLLAAFAEHEREQISTRTKDALRAAKRLGVPLGKHGKEALNKINTDADFAASQKPIIEELKAEDFTTILSWRGDFRQGWVFYAAIEKVAATAGNRPKRSVTMVTCEIPDFWADVGIGKNRYINSFIINCLFLKTNFVTFGYRQVAPLLLPVIVGSARVS